MNEGAARRTLAPSVSGSSPLPTKSFIPPADAAAAWRMASKYSLSAPPLRPITERYSPPSSCGSWRKPRSPKRPKYFRANALSFDGGIVTCTASTWPSAP